MGILRRLNLKAIAADKQLYDKTWTYCFVVTLAGAMLADFVPSQRWIGFGLSIIGGGFSAVMYFLRINRKHEESAAAGRGLDGLEQVSRLKPGWDSYGGDPPSEKAKAVARIMLGSPAWVTPCSDGGIQIEWHEHGWDVEIVIGPDGDLDGLAERAVVERGGEVGK